MPKANAVKWLKAEGVATEVLSCEFIEIGVHHAAETVARPLQAECRTLVVGAAGQQYWVAIIPGDQRFDAPLMADRFHGCHGRWPMHSSIKRCSWKDWKSAGVSVTMILRLECGVGDEVCVTSCPLETWCGRMGPGSPSSSVPVNRTSCLPDAASVVRAP